LVTDTDEALEWDGENRLTGMWRGPWKEELAQVPFESLVGEAVAGSTVWRWGYDHRSRRVQRDEPGSDGERLRTVTVFSGGTSAAEYTETAAAGSAAGSAWTVPPAATVQHVRGPDLGGGTKGLLYSLRNGLPTFNRYNGRGDVVAQSDIDGTTTWAASYQADGRRTAEAGTNVERHRACTKEEDPTGLLNEGFRYRDMETGTFISRDPLGLVDGPNVYAYVQQNPWSKFDADGLFWSAVITAGFAVYDTYQYATGQMNGAEYAGAMALNGAALLADVSTAGMGGGLLVRAGSAAVKVAKVVDKADTVYSTVNGAIRTSEAIANGDGTGAVVNGLLTAVGAKQMGGGGKAPDAPGLAPPSGKSAQDTMGEPRPLDLPGAGTVEAAKGGGFCFPAGTMVVMADGSARAIEEIKEGDEVMADDPADALPPSSKPVTHLHKNWTQRFIHIHIDTNSDGLTDAQLRATGEHPFWVVGKGWVDAQELQSGDALMSDGVASPVVVATESVATTADTFNLTVRDSHTFFVRAGLVSVLVHNTEPWEFNSSVDLDWTGRGGNGYQQMHGALDEAFSRTGVPRSSFEVSTWGLDQHGKSFPTEWRAPGGAEVNIDDPRLVRSANGP
jgi:RHS repeat-associated protein